MFGSAAVNGTFVGAPFLLARCSSVLSRENAIQIESYEAMWRRGVDLNHRKELCRPLPYHLGTAPHEISSGSPFESIRVDSLEPALPPE